MFSSQQTDELVFHQIPSFISFQQPATNQQDLIALELSDHVIMEDNTNNSVSKARKRHRDQSHSSKPNYATTEKGIEDEQTKRKLVHREIERQRRQEMSKLYASLRDLLPLEFVKGKRSISDHMHQAVNYIKHMQENIKVLSFERDRLRKFVERSVPGPETNTSEKSLMNMLLNTVSISFSDEVIQILINSCLIEDGFPLSGVLKAIFEEGLYVITYTCTKVNQRLLHCIKSEVNDLVSIDISMLQQRLTAIITTEIQETVDQIH